MRILSLELIRAAADTSISRETWALLDQEQRRDLREAPLPAIVSDQPTDPLTPQQIAAAEAADAAAAQIAEKIALRHQTPAPRALNCGSCCLHLRRGREGGLPVEDALVRTSCGRSDCPYCWRHRWTRSQRRAAGCLLYAEAEDDKPGLPGRRNLPRVETVHVAEADWSDWNSLYRKIKRRRGWGTGILRVRRDNNTLLIVCELPFTGSRPATPTEALAIASAAIDALHTRRHSFRLLGRWSDRQKPQWRLLGRLDSPINYKTVRRLIEEFGTKARSYSSPHLSALLWRTGSEDAAEELFWAISTSLAIDSSDPYGANSATAAPPTTPSTDLLAAGFDPTFTPWG